MLFGVVNDFGGTMYRWHGGATYVHILGRWVKVEIGDCCPIIAIRQQISVLCKSLTIL